MHTSGRHECIGCMAQHSTASDSPTLNTMPAAWKMVQCSMMVVISKCTVITTAVNSVAPVCHCPGVAPTCLSGYRGVRQPMTSTNTSTAWKAELSSQPVTAFRSKYWLRGPAWYSPARMHDTCHGGSALITKHSGVYAHQEASNL